MLAGIAPSSLRTRGLLDFLDALAADPETWRVPKVLDVITRPLPGIVDREFLEAEGDRMNEAATARMRTAQHQAPAQDRSPERAGPGP